jgi:hypothetical protein
MASGVAVDLVADALVVGSEAVATTAGRGDETTAAGDLVVVATGAGLGFSMTVLET